MDYLKVVGLIMAIAFLSVPLMIYLVVVAAVLSVSGIFLCAYFKSGNKGVHWSK